MTTQRIDAHHHVWQLGRGDYGWLTGPPVARHAVPRTPALAPICRDFSLADLRPLLRGAGIAGTVLVQAAPTVAETEFLLATARASEGLVLGVVGWVDLASRNAPDVLAALAHHPLLKSVRPMLQDLPDPDWILRPEIGPALAALGDLDLRFDALVKPAQLPALVRLLDRYPDLAVVVDHGGKPAISGRAWEPWARLMAEVARHPHAHCKLSGLVTEAERGWTTASLARYVDHLLECFGTGRLMWGSDWPVVNLAGGYARWTATTQELLSALPAADREAILGANACRFYGLR